MTTISYSHSHMIGICGNKNSTGTSPVELIQNKLQCPYSSWWRNVWASAKVARHRREEHVRVWLHTQHGTGWVHFWFESFVSLFKLSTDTWSLNLIFRSKIFQVIGLEKLNMRFCVNISPARQSSDNPSVSLSPAISGRSLHCEDKTYTH